MPTPRTDARPPTEPHAEHRAKPDWARLRLWQIQAVRDIVVLLAIIGLLWLGYTLRLVTVPILLALALAYLFEPLVAWVTRKRLLSRTGAASAIIVLTALGIVVPVGLGLTFGAVQGVKYAQRLSTSVDVFLTSVDAPEDAALRARVLDRGRTWLRARDYIVEQEKRRLQQEHARASAPPADGAPPAQEPGPGPSDLYRVGRLGVEWVRDHAAEIGKRALQGGAGAVSAVAGLFGSLGTIIFTGFLTAFFFFFLCTGYGRVLEFWQSMIPEKRKGRMFFLLSQMDRVIAGFIRGRLTICACMMVLYSIGYWLIGVPAPLVVGPAVGLLCLLPYAAMIVGVPLAILLLALEPSGAGLQSQWWWVVFAPVVVMMVAQGTDDYFLTPRIQGKTTNMDTPTILFASLAGGVLAGVYGLLIAIPTAACLRILLRETFWPRFARWSRGEAHDMLPIEDS